MSRRRPWFGGGRSAPHTGRGPLLPVPCDECYSIESYSRRIPYEPDSRTAVDGYPQPAERQGDAS